MAVRCSLTYGQQRQYSADDQRAGAGAASNRSIFSLKKNTEARAKVKIMSICASDFTTAACCGVIAIDQPNERRRRPASEQRRLPGLQAMRPISARSFHSIQTSMITVWNVMTKASVTAACIMKIRPAKRQRGGPVGDGGNAERRT